MKKVLKTRSIENRQDQTLRRLGIFRTIDAIHAGVSQPTVSRLTEKGTLIRLEHGLYHHRDTKIDPATQDFAIACKRLGPNAVIGGLTALFYYGLITQVPNQTWVILPHTNRGKFPQYRVIHTKHKPKVAVADEGLYRIVTVERAIIEAFQYATKMGSQTSLTAVRIALRERKTTEKKLHETAKQLGLWKMMVRHWEAITTP